MKTNYLLADRAAGGLLHVLGLGSVCLTHAALLLAEALVEVSTREAW